jgi:hypothetical protein
MDKGTPDPGDPSRRSFIQAGAGVVVGAAAVAGAGRQLQLLRSESDRSVTGARERHEIAYADIELRVNGQPHAVRVPHQRTLLLVLREDLGLTGTKKSCNLGQCGACTVLVDGLPVYACMLLGSRAASGAGRFHPPHGESMRPLHTRDGNGGGRAATEEPTTNARRRSQRSQRQPVPVRQLPERDRGRAVSSSVRRGVPRRV